MFTTRYHLLDSRLQTMFTTRYHLLDSRRSRHLASVANFTQCIFHSTSLQSTRSDVRDMVSHKGQHHPHGIHTFKSSPISNDSQSIMQASRVCNECHIHCSTASPAWHAHFHVNSYLQRYQCRQASCVGYECHIHCSTASPAQHTHFHVDSYLQQFQCSACIQASCVSWECHIDINSTTTYFTTNLDVHKCEVFSAGHQEAVQQEVQHT